VIKSSISWFISSKEDVEFVKDYIKSYKFNVQLAFYERNDLDFVDDLVDIDPKYVSSIHLPKGLTYEDYAHEGGVVKNLRDAFNVDLFVVHPWLEDLDRVCNRLVAGEEGYSLCLEVFRSKKTGQGNVFRLLADFGKYFQTDWVGLCLDLSHLEKELCHWTVFKNFLPYTKMIHASCKIGKQQHTPVFPIRGEWINAVSLISSTLSIKNLEVREIVLEYMKQYKVNLVKHGFWLQGYVQEKRRRWGTDEEKKELEV
jgi:hypothetical protein